MTDPATNKPLKPRTLGGPEIAVKTGEDMRVKLFEWMRSPENPYFARNFVNRVWAHYFGVGLVDPVDDFSVANPPTNARLLDSLAKDFVDHRYNMRRLEKTILLSATYQTSSKPNDTNKFDKNNFARAYIRPLMAEVVVDEVNAALGTTEQLGPNMPEHKNMTEIGATRLANGNLTYALRLFGRPSRATTCDCERAAEPTLPRTLYLMTDAVVLGKLQEPKNRLNSLLKSNRTDAEILEELFLATLSRLPTSEEKAAFIEHLKSEKDRKAAFVRATWALINTREFELNH